MFQLNKEEWDFLRLQIVILENGKGKYPKYLPFAFTEQDVAMLSSVLNSSIAIKVNIQIIRIFTRMRELLLSHKDILLKLEQMEKDITQNKQGIAIIFEALKQLLQPPAEKRKRIDF